MSNVVSIKDFKNAQSINSVMEWFEQFPVSELCLEMIRCAIGSHAQVPNTPYELPFTLKATTYTPYNLDLVWVSEGAPVLTVGWVASCNFAMVGGLQAMKSYDVSTREKATAYHHDLVHRVLRRAGLYTGFGGAGSPLAMGLFLTAEMNNRAVEMCEYVDEDGDHHFAALVGDEDEQQVFSVCIFNRTFNRTLEYNTGRLKTQMPKAGPIWENVKGGKIRAKIVATKKPESPLFKRGNNKEINKWIGEVLTEEIVGDDRAAMERFVHDLLAWHEHYHTYFNMQGWTYEVTWKG